jgi:uncharacterized membrane protein
MNRQACPERRQRIIFIVSALLILFALSQSQTSAPASAQSGGTYDLTWNTLDGGGATFSAGGAYELGGTIGQADAGTMSGGQYALGGGFWGFLDSLSKLFLPLIIK